jgi:hypothetical protein
VIVTEVLAMLLAEIPEITGAGETATPVVLKLNVAE